MVKGLFEFSLFGSNLVEVFRLDHIAKFFNQSFNFGLIVRRHLVTQVTHLLLGLIGKRVSLVFQVNPIAFFFVTRRVDLGIAHHLLDFGFVECRCTRNANGLFFACALVLGRNTQDSVCINVKGNFNLRHTTRRGWNSIKTELAEALVVVGHFPFALKDVDFHVGLSVHSSGESFRLLGRNGGVAGNDLGHNTTKGFDTQGQWSYVEQQ